jgi:hypothetical protein
MGLTFSLFWRKMLSLMLLGHQSVLVFPLPAAAKVRSLVNGHLPVL